MNWAIASVFAVASYLGAKFGFFIPQDLQVFNGIAAVSALVGYMIGDLVGRKTRRLTGKTLLVVGAFVVCVGCAIGYTVMIQMGSANVSHIWTLGALLA